MCCRSWGDCWMNKLYKIPDLLWFQEGPGVRNTQYTQNGVKLLNVANLVNGKVDLSTSNRYISEEEAYGKYNHFLVDDGDFIIASSGIQVEYFDKKMGFIDSSQLPLCMNTSTIRFKVINKNILDIRYFMYFLKSSCFKKQLSKQIAGSAQLNFGPSHLKKMTIPLIEIDKQKVIVTNLDKVTHTIDLCNSILEKLDLLVKSQFVEMFGDIEDKRTMADLCSIITDGTHQPPCFTESGIPFLFVSNIVANEITYNSEKFISEETYNELYKRTPIEKGDIVLSTVGSYGHPAVVKTDKKFLFQRHIAYLKPISNIVNSVYMHSAILSNDVQRQIDERVKGIAQKTLNLSEIRKIVIPLPPLDLQNQFADFVQQVDKSKLAVKKTLEKAETLKKALMQEYFG